MTKEELKQKYPQTYNEIVQEGAMQYRKEILKQIEAKEAFNFKLN